MRDLAKGRQACIDVNTQARIHSPEDIAASKARKGIDELAEVLSGNPAPFALKPHST
jgi:hypothetical protein